MKKITNFFRGLLRIFDKYVIMPVTRLIFKITKKFNVPNKTFETWLSYFYHYLSLLLYLLW